MKKYLLFIDVDGTLVPIGKQQMDEKISKGFERIQQDGHVVAIVSGRSQKSILSVSGTEKAKYLCGLMGCSVIDMQTNEQVIRPTPIDKELLRKFIEEINSLGLKWIYKDWYTEKSCFDDPELIKKYVPKIVKKEEFYKDMENLNVFQLLVNGNVPESLTKKYPEFSFIGMPGEYFDVLPKGATKANTVNYLKSLYPDHISVAIGDSANDIEMLENCSIKIVMGDAQEQLKKISTHITKSVQELGVLYAIENILKI